MKHFLFNSVTGDYKIIGTRSLKHYSTTFLDFLNIHLDQKVNISISLVVAALIIVFIIISKSELAVVGLSIILAGTIGNTVDNIYLGYVRDILYTPWLDRGTFNLADVLIIVGLPIAFIPTIFNLYK